MWKRFYGKLVLNQPGISNYKTESASLRPKTLISPKPALNESLFVWPVFGGHDVNKKLKLIFQIVWNL